MYPVLLFVYNKPETTLQTLKALENNQLASDSDVYIFSDGAKDDANENTRSRIEQVRDIIKQEFRFKSCTIIESPTNKGLAESITTGVSELLKRHEAAIIVEDDVLTSKHFLQFMNHQLDQFKDDQQVFSVGSWNYFFPGATNNFFFRVPDSIAWGVYRRSWRFFEKDSNRLVSEITSRGLIHEFNVANSYDYFGMLQKQSEKKVDSWAIRWYASCFLNKGLTVYPNISISKHIGYGEDAAHCKDPEDLYRQNFDVADNLPMMQKIKIQESSRGVNEYVKFHKGESGFFNKVVSKLRQYNPFY